MVLFGFHPAFLEHETPKWHPEAGVRLDAVLAGAAASGVSEALRFFAPPETGAELAHVLRVHDQSYLDRLAVIGEAGGGYLDPDTHVGPSSLRAALLAAGTGLEAVRLLATGGDSAAFLALRPPGHHAGRSVGMGFCLLNNVAITARALADQGRRVAIVDFDAHHGNGTQEIFYEDPGVLYVSLHQYPWYPGTGAFEERGSGAGEGTTLNIPLPAKTAGTAYRMALDLIVDPALERFGPDWLLLSAGFDAHRADPLTDLGLTSGDFAEITAHLSAIGPRGRLIAFLEGGYDLAALRDSAGACVAALAGVRIHPEEPTTSGAGCSEVRELAGALRQQ